MAIIETAPAQQTGTGNKPSLVIGDRDIVFNCPHCEGELVIDRDGAGISVPCSHCGQPITIPDFAHATGAVDEVPPADSAAPPAPPLLRHFDFADKPREQLERRFSDLQHQFKENRSQDTEMRGHVNRATMELHRLQLKLKKLQERHADIEAEITALTAWMETSPE